MNPEKNNNFYDWSKKSDTPPMFLAADFEHRNVQLDDPQRNTLLISNQVAVG